MIGREETVDSSPENRARHQRILEVLRDDYDRPVMNNTHRADYVECLVVVALGGDWERTWDWDSWDCQHTSGARLEVKQSAARQPWDKALSPRRAPRFDIASRTGYWTSDGSWVDSPGRSADLYVFAWHGERRDGYADHCDADQWRFFVVAEPDLPNQKSIGLKGLQAITSACRITDLARAVRDACPAPEALKAVLEPG